MPLYDWSDCESEQLGDVPQMMHLVSETWVEEEPMEADGPCASPSSGMAQPVSGIACEEASCDDDSDGLQAPPIECKYNQCNTERQLSEAESDGQGALVGDDPYQMGAAELDKEQPLSIDGKLGAVADHLLQGSKPAEDC